MKKILFSILFIFVFLFSFSQANKKIFGELTVTDTIHADKAIILPDGSIMVNGSSLNDSTYVIINTDTIKSLNGTQIAINDTARFVTDMILTKQKRLLLSHSNANTYFSTNVVNAMLLNSNAAITATLGGAGAFTVTGGTANEPFLLNGLGTGYTGLRLDNNSTATYSIRSYNAGDALFPNYFQIQDIQSGISFFNVNPANLFIGLGQDVSAPTAQLDLFGSTSDDTQFAMKVRDFAGTGQLFNIRNDGNIGIGIDTGQAKLHIKGGNILIDGTDSLHFTDNTVSFSATSSGNLVRDAAISDILMIGGAQKVLAISTGFLVNSFQSGMDFLAKGDGDFNLLRTDASTDRVGIGIAAPTEKIHLTGGNFLIDGTNKFMIRDTNQFINSSLAGFMDFDATLAYQFKIAAANKVTIGPAGMIVNVAQNGQDFTVQGDGAVSLIKTDASTDRVGFKVTTPSVDYHFGSGTTRMDGLTASQIVETDASKNLISAAKATGYNLALGTSAGTVLEGDNDALYVKLAGSQTITGQKTFSDTTRINSVSNIGTDGTFITNFKHGSVSVDPPNISGNSEASFTVTISGLVTTDRLFLTPDTLEEQLIFKGARIISANTVTIKIANVQTGAVDGAALNWNYFAIKP
ncbi:MAG: hypothetical protein ACE5H1_01940 [Thermodesulfobacteriota bacterium]